MPAAAMAATSAENTSPVALLAGAAACGAAAIAGATVLIHSGAAAGLSRRACYPSVGGRPNCGNTSTSANHVIAEMRSRSRVSTNSAKARATPVSGTGR